MPKCFFLRGGWNVMGRIIVMIMIISLLAIIGFHDGIDSLPRWDSGSIQLLIHLDTTT